MSNIESTDDVINRMEWFEAAIAEIEATGELSIPPVNLFHYPVDTIINRI